MAKKSRMAVLKRQRELKKAEKAALKRDRREVRRAEESHDAPTQADLEGYGLATEAEEEPKEEESVG